MCILQNYAESFSQCGLFDLGDIYAVIPYLTVLDIVEAVYKVGDGGLACAC